MANGVSTAKRGRPGSVLDGESAFRLKRAELLRTHKGEFVALYQGRVVAKGRDDEELARRLYDELGDVPFYIARVEEEPTVYDLPSPETVR